MTPGMKSPCMPARDLLKQLHEHFLFGRDRASEMLNELYIIPSPTRTALLSQVKEQCHSSFFKGNKPPNPPTTPITSMDFGERILVDLKTLTKGFMIVTICHWSKFC